MVSPETTSIGMVTVPMNGIHSCLQICPSRDSSSCVVPGEVVAETYEYGNSFLVVAGLLNVLVVIDAYDIALGRK